MKILTFRIGEFHIKVISNSVYTLNSFENFEVNTGKTVNPDIIIHLKDSYGVPFTTFNVDITKEQEKISYSRADYLIEIDSNFRNATISVHDDFALKHALMNLFSHLMVYHNWGLLIHSSCVVDNNKAHMFSGQSGAGKSTAAKLSAPRDLLSDEATIVKITSQEITIFNSPFRSEIKSKTIVEPKSLESIQLLNQALQNKREILRRSDALIHLIDKVFYWAHSPDEIVQIFGLLHKLVKTVPVYELYFQKNNRFWELIS